MTKILLRGLVVDAGRVQLARGFTLPGWGAPASDNAAHAAHGCATVNGEVAERGAELPDGLPPVSGDPSAG